ncbi:unnamed protein product [Cylicostephanus goldi]|uniref:Uncharacterized protein n=1 Tax=Cylicostephanus goldi TaxID=71465 RepID=A0A3P7NAW8_CYLGO|nr:unnamed protein product [Cylicostephanus goldi]
MIVYTGARLKASRVAKLLNIQTGKSHENDLKSVGNRVEEKTTLWTGSASNSTNGDRMSFVSSDAYPVEMAPTVFIGGCKLGRHSYYKQIQHQAVDRYGSRRSR